MRFISTQGVCCVSAVTCPMKLDIDNHHDVSFNDGAHSAGDIQQVFTPETPRATALSVGRRTKFSVP